MTYYNTTHVKGLQLETYSQQAANQDDQILSIFRMSKTKALGPSKVHDILQAQGHYWPITSVRRSITNLTTAGRLYKTDQQVTGKYGRPEHLWKLCSYEHQNQT